MKEKLSEMIQSAVGGCAKYWADVIADKLIAEGVIVPTVAIGAKVYIIGWCGDIEEFVVRGVRCETDGKGACSYGFRAVMGEESDIHFREDYIGITVFLTRQEAEKALERSEDTE